MSEIQDSPGEEITRRGFFSSVGNILLATTGISVACAGIIGVRKRINQDDVAFEALQDWKGIKVFLESTEGINGGGTLYDFTEKKLREIYEANQKFGTTWDSVCTKKERIEILKRVVDIIQQYKVEHPNKIPDTFVRQWEEYANIENGSLQ